MRLYNSIVILGIEHTKTCPIPARPEWGLILAIYELPDLCQTYPPAHFRSKNNALAKHVNV